MRKIIFSLLVILLSVRAEAGVVALTIHSRANCGNNESISWDMRWYRQYATISTHFFIGNETRHVIYTDWEDTWRSAAVHWGEALPGSGWAVVGDHLMIDPYTGRTIYLGLTHVVDCSIYDGWWDHYSPVNQNNLKG